MTWTYAMDFTTVRDQMRLQLGDTESTLPLMQDQELAQFYALYPSVPRAVAKAALALAARLTLQSADFTLASEIRVNFSERATQLVALARRLESDASVVTAGVYAGGISVGDKQTQEDTSDRPPPAFTRDLQGVRATPTWTGEEDESC